MPTKHSQLSIQSQATSTQSLMKELWLLMSSKMPKMLWKPPASCLFQSTISAWWACKMAEIHQLCLNFSKLPVSHMPQLMSAIESTRCLGHSCYRCERSWLTKLLTSWEKVVSTKMVQSTRDAILMILSWSMSLLPSKQALSIRSSLSQCNRAKFKSWWPRKNFHSASLQERRPCTLANNKV